MAWALLSVWDKRGIEEIGRELAASGLQLAATGGTAWVLRDAGLHVTEVSDLTGFPEILDGRVKTLHPAIHAGLLARRDDPGHMATMAEHGLDAIDVVVSNLYPFAEVARRPGVRDEEAIEHIDIGGPAMIRAAAKNHAGVIVLVDPNDYAKVLQTLKDGGPSAVTLTDRRRLAAKAFGHVSVYDSLVTSYLSAELFPQELPLGATLLQPLRYGENPHQQAALYELRQPGPAHGIATWRELRGKELSYNNYLDATAAWSCAQRFADPTVVIVKHTLPCGVGSATTLPPAYERALSGDPVSAYGGILAANRDIDEETVEAIGRQHLDVMIAPGYSAAALARLRRKRNLRIISAQPDGADRIEVRSVPGGLLVQTPDTGIDDPKDWHCVTERQPTADEQAALAYAWRVLPLVKSNAIVLAQPNVVVGIGAGQPNRLESVRIAARVAGERAIGSGLASDAFFPFPDGIESAATAGVTAIVQPGGSIRDEECVAAADSLGLAMLFTGRRHFRH
jgi:phosphoribosylaminoimidazolecarboxamide formyltransferase/IMP cyclohydrolase